MPLPPLVEPAPSLSAAELRRYSRHVSVPGLGVLGQRRLRNARVLVVGAGGLGSPVLLYLAAAGVGTIGVVDSDTVEESNLQRQVIHGQSDLGRHKTDSARDAIAEVNPHVEVVRHAVRLEAGNALEILGGYDVVVDGSDNFATRYLVDDAATLLGLPCVWGSILRFEGQVSVFWDRHGPTYRHLYPEPPPPGTVPSCAEGGVLGAVCAAIGSVMAIEVIKLVTGIGDPLLGRLLTFDASGMAWREVPVRRDPRARRVTELVDEAVTCGAVPGSGVEGSARDAITASELRAMLVDGVTFDLVDVREPAEAEIVRIPGARLVPQGRILDGSALAELPRDRPVVLHCRSGVRSAECLAVLRAAGFDDAVHLAGGVLAWVDQVDPSLPRY